MAALLAAASVTVTFLSSTPVNTVDEKFASWNIDSSCNRGFHRTNFSNPNLAAAGLGLAPSRLRFGGSGNDNRTLRTTALLLREYRVSNPRVSPPQSSTASLPGAPSVPASWRTVVTM